MSSISKRPVTAGHQGPRTATTSAADPKSQNSRSKEAPSVQETAPSRKAGAQAVADAVPRLSADNAPKSQLHPSALQAKLPRARLSAAQKTALAPYGLSDEQLDAFLAGGPIAFEMPSIAGQATIGTIQMGDNDLKSTCISVHDTKDGFKTLLSFRRHARTAARAFGKDTYILAGAAVINGKLEQALKNQHFEPGTAAVPDELGNDGNMEVYERAFKS